MSNGNAEYVDNLSDAYLYRFHIELNHSIGGGWRFVLWNPVGMISTMFSSNCKRNCAHKTEYRIFYSIPDSFTLTSSIFSIFTLPLCCLAVHHVCIIGATIIAHYCILPLTVRHSSTSTKVFLTTIYRVPWCLKFLFSSSQLWWIVMFLNQFWTIPTSIHKSAKTSTSEPSVFSTLSTHVPPPFPQGGFCE